MEEFKGDKRTKAYRDFKAKFEEANKDKPEGIGDVIHNVLQSKPIKPITDIVKKMIWNDSEDCNCQERQKEFNRMFPFQKPNCLTEEEYQWLTNFSKTKKIRVTFDERQHLFDVYNRVFGTNLKITSCPSCITNMINKLNVILKTYN